MMSQRFNLFYAGFTAYLPSLHFNQAALLQQLENHPKVKSFGNCCDHLKHAIDDSADEAKVHLTTALQLAGVFELSVPQEPQTVSEYFSWQSQYADTFENRFPMSRIDHYYFLYGRKNAEIICNTSLMASYLELILKSERKLDYSSNLTKCLKDTEYILFKLIAASALLSSEPRQTYFSAHYKTISTEFKPFRVLDFSVLSDEELLRLTEDLVTYRNTVMDGFKNCISLLKELQF
jgi:hypothetical protein